MPKPWVRLLLLLSMTTGCAVAEGGEPGPYGSGGGSPSKGTAGSSWAPSGGTAGTGGDFGLAGGGSGGLAGAGSGGLAGAGSGGVAGAGSGGVAGAGSGGVAGAGSGGVAAAGSSGSAGAGSGGTSSGETGGAPSGGSSSGGSSSGGSSGSGASGGVAGSSGCPAGTQPPGPFAMRFDTATLNCGASGACSPSSSKCFCQGDFDELNSSGPHWMAVGTDNHKAEIWAAGNVQAVYVDDLNANIAAGGAARATAAIDKAKTDFPCGVPAWFVVNEISAGLWPGDASYRQFAIDFAKTMKNTYGKKLILAAPFATPGANDASWTELAKYAYVGVESYLSGNEINAHANSVSWCQAQYQASVNAYLARGVPKSKLVLFEHFGNTQAGTAWGRSGVSVAGWHNAIKARSQAIKNIGFAGFASYGWANNDMGASNSDRQAFMATYNAQNLP